ncbi:MAG: carboxypeptidase regulatory-like domain-containing protein [Chloroflexi bacterium]|nr:carboxypeptidase regulatory-like domain-containing protein [Chloroflexota bacterium]MYC02888.1 carboxypeptidase regulatory-like domain-containing protein [Chloroflexota bacterium]
MCAYLTIRLAAIAGALIIVVLPALLSADDGAAGTPTDRTITLQPGDNFVGWVDEPLSLDALQDQLQSIERVATWNTDERREVSATVDGRRWSGPLQTLEPGRAYVIRIGGDSPVDWTRPIVPAVGLVELRTGENWAAWLGPDDWAITDVAKGIGTFLSEIRLGDLIYDPANPETADDWLTVSRGDALVVTVSRGVNWLQPTFVMPRLVFAGNVGHGIRNHAKRDLADMSAYIADEFGVQADPFRLVVTVAGDVRSLFDELEQQGHPREYENLRNWWRTGSGGYHSGGVVNVIKEEQWEINMGRYSRARYVLLEEYFHAVQRHLRGDNADRPPTWMLEGSINWIRGDLSTLDRTGYPLSRRLIRALNQASQGPSLEDVESGNQTWQYSFGLVAADLLVKRAGVAAMLDFFRAFAPGRTGPNAQWESQLTWQGAFAAAYGIPVEEFYAEFEELMAKRRGSARRRPASNQVSLTGAVVDSEGTPRSGVRLTSYEIKNDAFTTFGSAQAKSDENGEFTLFVRRRADHRIQVRLSDSNSCKYWWTSDGEGEAQSAVDAELIEVGISDPPPLTITVDADKCRWRITGVLTGPDEEPLAGIQVLAQSEGSWISARTEIDGSFELVTLAPGPHQLSVNLGGCRLYWGPESRTTERSGAGEIEVVDQDVTDIRFEVSSNPCITISGHLLDADGNSIEGVRIHAQAGDGSNGGRTDANGRFEIGLSGPGEYYMYTFIDGCRVYYRETRATGAYADLSLITVSEGDVSSIVFQLQEEMCTLRVSGTLLNADGSPRSGVYLRAQDGPLLGGDWPAEDGSFSFTVPAAGSYNLNVTIDGCRVYYGGEVISGGKDQARALSLSRSNVSDIRFVLPENPCLTISGHLLDADGNGFANVEVYVGSNSVRTDADGRFQIAVSEAGDYRLYAWIDGCLIYYRQDGATGAHQEHTPIRVSDGDVAAITLQLQPGMCTLRISGRILNSDGSPRTGLFVRGQGEVGEGGAWPANDGAFSFTVPSDGSYRLVVWIDGCGVHYTGDGDAGRHHDAHTFSLSDADITGIEFRLPEDPASVCD